MSTVRLGARTGTVTSFDDASGLGTISVSDIEAGDIAVPFHCITIADGSRSIEVGAVVTFDVIAKLGRYEAADIRPL
jgi:cold shock CspA family protein